MPAVFTVGQFSILCLWILFTSYAVISSVWWAKGTFLSKSLCDLGIVYGFSWQRILQYTSVWEGSHGPYTFTDTSALGSRARGSFWRRWGWQLLLGGRSVVHLHHEQHIGHPKSLSPISSCDLSLSPSHGTKGLTQAWHLCVGGVANASQESQESVFPLCPLNLALSSAL